MKEQKYKVLFENIQLEEVNFSIDLRLGFIRKVYGIIGMQLLITTILCSLTFNSSTQNFMTTYSFLYYLSIILHFGILICFLSFKPLSQKVPINYILLSLWTVSTGYIVAYYSLGISPSVILTASFSTLLITISITIYALFAKTDFTAKGGIISTIIGTLIIVTVLYKIISIIQIVILIIGLIIYSGYLIYDTQLIWGSLGTEFSPEDYIFASMCIYLDILKIFLKILDIFKKDD
jgi:FtsH-binding integral membrane protein